MIKRKIKFIPWSKPKLFGLEKKLVTKAINTSWISGGKYIDLLELEFKKFLKVKHAFLVSNGTAAIHCAFLSLNLKVNDEIIVPGYGYMAAANIAKLMNIKIKFADVDRDTFCVSLDNIKKLKTKNTRVVVITHTYGNIHEVDKIKTWCSKNNIKLIEDAAEAMGSKFKKKFAGTFGDIGTFSLHATKNITTGEGGLVVTNNDKIASLIKLYRSHGVLKKRYYHIVPGHNFRITNFQAAMGLAQMKNKKKIFLKRKIIFMNYKKELDNNKFIIQKIDSKSDFVPWTQAIYFKNKKINYEKISYYLMKKGIETRNGFYSANRLPIYKVKKSKISNSDFLSKNIICLPIFYDLKIKDVKKICSYLNHII